jgi:hypothetical protein
MDCAQLAVLDQALDGARVDVEQLGRLLRRQQSYGDARRATRAGKLRIVPEPWGTRGYDDLRIRAFRENLGRGVRPQVASIVDCVHMLDASEREVDAQRLLRLRRMMELERHLVPQRRLGIER